MPKQLPDQDHDQPNPSNRRQTESGKREENSPPTRQALSRPTLPPPPTNSDPQASRDWLNAKREQMVERSNQSNPLNQSLSQSKSQSLNQSKPPIATQALPNPSNPVSLNQPNANRPVTPPMKPRPSVKRASASPREPKPQEYLPPSMRGNSPLSGLLQNVVGGMDASAKIQESLALAYWPRAVGVQGAAATEVDTVRDGVLFVRTKSSVWSHELTLHKPKLLQNLNRMLGSKVIHDIIFRAQGITRQEKIVPVDTPGAEELAAIVLEPEEKAELRVRLRKLISIPDDRIRHAIAVRLTNEAKLQHWRLERGWRLCMRCHVPHKTDADICPLCRLNR